MAYCTVAHVRQELGIDDSEDDALLTLKVSAAQSIVDQYTRRTWEAGADAVHYFTVGKDTRGALLLLDDDLVSITSVVTNADNTSPDTIPSTDYVTLPRNRTPYYGIKIINASVYDWRASSDAEMGIEVTGKWAHTLTAPADIQQACIRLAAFLYRQKDANIFDVTASLETGEMILPKGTPQDVINILNRRRKAIL